MEDENINPLWYMVGVAILFFFLSLISPKNCGVDSVDESVRRNQHLKKVVTTYPNVRTSDTRKE